jgi:Zn-dependent protease with chaperone function
VRKPLCERLGQTRIADLGLGLFDRVFDASVFGPAGGRVEQRVGGPRISVARLANRARVEDPAADAREVELRAAGRDDRLQALLGEAEREWDVTVPDEDDPSLGGREGAQGRERSQNVFPDGIPGARVVEGDLALVGLRLESIEEAVRIVLEHVRRPARDRCGVHGEIVQVQPTEDAEIVISYQADVGALGDERAALVRLRAVPDEVAEAPDRIGLVRRDRLEHSFQRMQIPMNVGEDGDAHWSRATLAKWAAVAAAAVVWVVSGALLWRTEVPHLDLAELDPRSYFSAAELSRIEDFRRISRLLFLGSVVVEGIVLGLLAWKGSWLVETVGGFTRGRMRTGVALGALAAFAVWLAILPLAGVAHWWWRRYGLSHQGYAGWLRDQVVSLAVMVVLVSITVALLVALAIWLGRSWWIAGGPVLALAGTVLILAYPLVIQPLFNDFSPLPDRELAAKIEALAETEGVTVKSVEVADASRQTTTPNAYVAGIGPTRRVVLFDTLLDGRFSEGEILSVAAHELAHVGRRHLWKGLGWFALIVIPCTFVVAWVTDRRGGLPDPAAVPLGLAVAFVLFVLTLPLSNIVSRRYEAEADWIALQTTRDPGSFIGVQQAFVRSGLTDPTPPSLYFSWFATHPSPLQRIAMAEAFTARPRGGS